MNDAASILVIILSLILTIFLVAAIILVIYLIQVIKKLKKVGTDAQNISGSLNSTMNNVSMYTSPVFLGKFISSFITKLRNK